MKDVRVPENLQRAMAAEAEAAREARAKVDSIIIIIALMMMMIDDDWWQLMMMTLMMMMIIDDNDYGGDQGDSSGGRAQGQQGPEARCRGHRRLAGSFAGIIIVFMVIVTFIIIIIKFIFSA